MIRYLKHKEIDKAAWDRCISASPNGVLPVISWYLDILAEDWDALVLDDYKAVMPLIFRRKYGIFYLYQPPFIQQTGVFGIVSLSAGLINEFVKAIPAKFLLREITFNYLNQLSDAGKHWSRKRNYILELLPGAECICQTYSENTRRNIAKALKSGLNAEYHFLPEQMVQLFRSGRGQHLALPIDFYEKFSRLAYECKHRETGDIVIAVSPENEVLAGVFFTFFRNRITLIMLAAGEEARRHGAMHFLINHLVSRFGGRDVVLDFEGGNDSGMARFYGGFGAKLQNYWFYRKSRLVVK